MVAAAAAAVVVGAGSRACSRIYFYLDYCWPPHCRCMGVMCGKATNNRTDAHTRRTIFPNIYTYALTNTNTSIDTEYSSICSNTTLVIMKPNVIAMRRKIETSAQQHRYNNRRGAREQNIGQTRTLQQERRLIMKLLQLLLLLLVLTV